MLRHLKNNNAQAVMGEYVLVFFLVMTVMVSMTIYFKRAVQARIYDARNYMVGEVRTRTQGQFDGNLYKWYEPYYANTQAVVTRSMDDTSTLTGGGSSGLFNRVYDQSTAVRVNSETSPPREFQATTPVN